MRNPRLGAIAALVLSLSVLAATAVAAIEAGQYRTVNGLAVYLGLLPAQMVAGHAKTHGEAAMHDGIPSGRHAYHVIVAVFDDATGERIDDAKVLARVASLGLGGAEKRLEPMEIEDTVTYGNFFDLPGEGPYEIDLRIERPGRTAAAVRFVYEHRLR